MNDDTRARMVGINHVALEVGDIEAALDFYGRIFRFELRGGNAGQEGGGTHAFIDMGDQFIALMKGRMQAPDEHRHFGLVVDNRARVRALAEAAGATVMEGRSLDFLDPWGNRVQVVEYRDIQFSKTDAVLEAMELDLEKSADARRQLRDKGIET